MTKNSLDKALEGLDQEVQQEEDNVGLDSDPANVYHLQQRRMTLKKIKDKRWEKFLEGWEHPVRVEVAEWVDKCRNVERRMNDANAVAANGKAQNNGYTGAQAKLQLLEREQKQLHEDFVNQIMPKLPEFMVLVKANQWDFTTAQTAMDLSAAFPCLHLDAFGLYGREMHNSHMGGFMVYSPILFFNRILKNTAAYRHINEAKVTNYRISALDMQLMSEELFRWCLEHNLQIDTQRLLSVAHRLVDGRTVSNNHQLWLWGVEIFRLIDPSVMRVFMLQHFMDWLIKEYVPNIFFKANGNRVGQYIWEDYLLSGVRLFVVEPEWMRGVHEQILGSIYKGKVLAVEGPAARLNAFDEEAVGLSTLINTSFGIFEQLLPQCEKPSGADLPPALCVIAKVIEKWSKSSPTMSLSRSQTLKSIAHTPFAMYGDVAVSQIESIMRNPWLGTGRLE